MFFPLVDHLDGWMDGWGSGLISIFWETLTNDSRMNLSLGQVRLLERQSTYPREGGDEEEKKDDFDFPLLRGKCEHVF